MSLKDLSIKLSYVSRGDDDIANEFIIPALKQAKIYKRSVGFFSSSVFEIIKAGLQGLIDNNGEIRIMCSPELSKEDIEAIELGYKLRDDYVKNKYTKNIQDILNDITDDNLLLLMRLIENNKLNIKIVSVESDYGIYHDKIGIIEDHDNNKVLFVGSPNESKTAYKSNYEKIRVSKSWIESDNERINDDEKEFDDIWNGTNQYVKNYDFTEAIAKSIVCVLNSRGVKYEGKFYGKDTEEQSNKGVKLRPYQEAAKEAWLKNGKKGFFVMATGTGKTWTAIYSAIEVIKNENILLVICAPYKHLVKQWYEDVHKVLPDSPIVLVSSENNNWENELIDEIYSVKYSKTQKTIIAISTIKSFESKRFNNAIEKAKSMNKMLIVDEAHRFKSRDKDIHNKYQYMLGLSATPSSKKDDSSAEELMNFFGGKVFNLPIEYAIEKGYLVKYNYYPIFVDAKGYEENEFDKYTRLMSSCFINNVCIDVEGCAKYKRSRLRVIAMAEEKNTKIDWILSHIKEEDHFIVYCGDGRLFEEGDSEGVRHIQFVKNHLNEKGYKVNQFTATEKMDERMKLVNMFNKGMLDSLVAIRCLDEGINIPSIKGAMILASNDDYREFVQRRGRILRTYHDEYNDVDKKIANIYDVIVLPSYTSKSFAMIELRRFYEYLRLAENYNEYYDKFIQLMGDYDIDINELMNVEDTEEEMDE